MPDLAQDLLRYVLIAIAAVSSLVIAIIVLDCISRIALGCGVMP